MSAVASRLVRLRTIEQRIARITFADANGAVDRADARIARLDQLSQAITPVAGGQAGGPFAAAGEYVARLAAGRLTVERQRLGESVTADDAAQRLARADARLDMAERLYKTAQSNAGLRRETVASRNLPAPRVPTW